MQSASLERKYSLDTFVSKSCPAIHRFRGVEDRGSAHVLPARHFEFLGLHFVARAHQHHEASSLTGFITLLAVMSTITQRQVCKQSIAPVTVRSRFRSEALTPPLMTKHAREQKTCLQLNRWPKKVIPPCASKALCKYVPAMHGHSARVPRSPRVFRTASAAL